MSWSGERPTFTAADRQRILRRARHRCEIHRPGCIGEATEADHRVPVAEGGSNDWRTNGQAGCAPCHASKTREEQSRGRARRDRRLRRPEEPHPGIARGA